MFDKGIFVFGSKIFQETKQDAISSLPLELSWKIFTYLDDMALRNATRASKVWRYIITSHKQLRSRLNLFELSITLGSRSLAKFYRNCKRKIKKEKNYLPVGEHIVKSTQTTVFKSKRRGEDLVIHAKRYKLN